MKAGPELDALVAEKVFGGVEGCVQAVFGTLLCAQHIDRAHHPYSTSIASAWQVIEKFKAQGTYCWIETPTDGDTNQHFWYAHFDQAGSEAETAPLAICLAALKAVGVEVPA